MERKGYSVQMSFDVPDAEKRVAEKASELFDELSGRLRVASNHLNIIYEPISKYEKIDSELLLEHREVFRNYRDQIKKNFETVMNLAFKAVILMGEFSTDTRTVEMMNSFIGSMKELEKQVNRLLGIFSDISNASFRDGIVRSIESVKEEANQVKHLINDRILNHIDTNILAKKWTSNVTDEYQNKVYEKLPLVVELWKERQKALDEGII